MRTNAPVVETPSRATAEAADRFKHRLAAFVARRAPADDVDDIVQTIFERAAKYDDALATADKPLAWLFRVARSALADFYREKARVPPAAEVQAVLNHEDAPTDEEIDLSHCIAPLLDTLPEKYRDAVRAVDLDGRSQVGLAEDLALSVSAVKSRVQRGRVMLKQALQTCCHIEVDRRGGVIDAEVRDKTVCGCSSDVLRT